MLVYRIGHKKYIGELIASGREGRWNGEGQKVIYAAGSVALALLENMVRRQGLGFNADFGIAVIQLPARITMAEILLDDLPAGWRSFRDYSHCQRIAGDWFTAMTTAVLKVPSAVLPQESNYVINTAHPQFTTVKIVGVTDLVPDERLEDLLRKYRNS